MPASQPSAIFRRFDGLEFFTIDFGVQPAGPSLEIVVDQPRATTDAEQAIGELRAWKLLGENWDGEQSLAPNQTSISQAIAFIYALEPRMPLPEPVLHSNGRAGLFWETAELTADLEFYDDGRVTYFVQKSERSKHRGVEIFTGEQLSGIFRALLG